MPRGPDDVNDGFDIVESETTSDDLRLGNNRPGDSTAVGGVRFEPRA
jgi:hypothetical protein